MQNLSVVLSRISMKRSCLFKYPILGVKSKDFEDWAKAVEIINSKAHLTKEGFEQIKLIKAGMNRGRENV